MKFQSKKIKIILIFVIILIILLGLFYLYTYLNSSNTPFDNFTVFQSFYNGEPSPTGDYTPTTNTKYNLQGVQVVTSNNMGLYALTDKTSIKLYSKTSNKWESQSIKLNAPQITNGQYDKSIQNAINCKASDGLLLTCSLLTLFMYDSFINNTNNVNCIYYMPLNSDGSISSNANLNCLALPLLSPRIVPSTTNSTNTPNLPLQPYDNIRILAANQSLLFALGCYDASSTTNPSSNDTGIYYCVLNNGIPSNNNANNWNYIGLPNNIIRNNINKLIVNDSYIFIHTSKVTSSTNSSIIYAVYYLPLSIQNNVIKTATWQKMGGNIDKPNGIDFASITMNNDVIWGIEQKINNRKTNLWWYPLNNNILTTGSSTDKTYEWKNIVIDTIGVLDVVLYNNNFIIFGSTNSSNLVIPLLGNYTPSPSISGTTVTGSAGSGTTATGSGSGSGSSGSGTTVTGSSGGSGSGGSGSGGSGSGGSGSGGSGSGGSGSGGSGSSGSGSGGSGSGGSGSSGSGSGSSGSGSSGSGSSGSGGSGTGGSGSGGSGSGGSGSDSSIVNVLDTISAHINGNKHNMNDFMSKNRLLGSNIYISPMNNSNLYVPNGTAPNIVSSNNNNVPKPTLSKLNIISSFFPSVELS